MTSNFIPNSFQVPNAYVDNLMHLLTLEEWAVLSYAARRIFGFQKRQDRIALSQFTSGITGKNGQVLDHGTGLNPATIRRALAALIQYNVMERQAANDPKKNEGDLYALQLDSDLVDWEGLAIRQQERIESKHTRTQAARAANKNNTPAPEPLPPTVPQYPLLSNSTPPLLSDSTTPPTVGQYNNNQGNTEKTRERRDARRAPSKRDERLDHPAIQLVRDTLRMYPPKATWDRVIETLGKEPNGERFRRVYEEWTLRGNKPTNLKGILEWYKNGIPQQKGNYSAPAAPQPAYYYADGTPAPTQ